MVTFVCLSFTLRFKTVWKRENEPCVALPVLPLPFDRVPILTAAGGLISSLSVATGSFGLHGFPSRRTGSIGTGIKVHFCRRRVTQRLVRTLLVIAVKPPAQPASGRQPVAVILQIDVLIFGAPPQPFDKPVVDPPPPTVHAHVHARRFHRVDKHRRGELRALVGIGNQRCLTSRPQRRLPGVYTKSRLHRVAQAPAQHVTTPPVHHR